MYVIKISKSSRFLDHLNSVILTLRKKRFKIPYWSEEGLILYTYISPGALKYVKENLPLEYQLLSHYTYQGL